MVIEIAVSYTHLDVYKRQGYTQQDDDCLVVLVCRQCRRFRQAFERVAHVGAQPPVLAAVSYTHLCWGSTPALPDMPPD